MSQSSENKRQGRAPINDAPASSFQDQTLDEKPFRLAKSFSMAAIVLIFASVLALAAIVSRQAEIIITKRVEDDTIKLMTNLNTQMYFNFLAPATARYGKISLGNQKQHDWLRQVISTTILGFDLQRVIIYNEDGQAVFATDDTSLPSPAEDRKAVSEAIVRYKDSPRLRFIGPDNSESFPTDSLAADDMSSSSDNWWPWQAFIQPRLTGRSYEQPSPYPYFKPSPFGDHPKNYQEDRLGEMDEKTRLPESELRSINEEPLLNPQIDPNDSSSSGLKLAAPAPDGNNDQVESFIEKGPEQVSPPSEIENEHYGPSYRVFSVGAIKFLMTDIDQNSPAAAQTIVGDEDFFLEYQRSQTVLRQEGGRYLLFNFFPRGKFMLKAYKVMESYQATRGPGLSGVLEINRDLTPEYKQIARLQYFSLAIALFLAVILTMSLRWVVSRGEAIINKRNQERQALQEQLDQAERLAGLGSMVATVAHEIRNPLGIIHSTADVLNRYLTQDPDQARLAKAIVEEADRLSTVVTEFLDFAKPPQPNPVPIIVEEILEEILAFLEITLARAGVEVRCEFRADQSPIMGDSSMLHRAFLNVIMNAVQAMDDGGLLTVSTKLETKNQVSWLAIYITDTGPGLSDDTAKKIFSPFYTTKAKGTGLGLVIVRNIIEGHGGTIEMISRQPTQDDETGLSVVISLKAGVEGEEPSSAT